MIAAILVGWNSRDYLEDSLSSLTASRGVDLRVIFVDNASSDDSVEFIRSRYPDVTIIQNVENTGFCRGNNIGIEAALKLGAEAVFLVNVDTVVEPDCLRLLHAELREDRLVQPLILLHPRETDELVNTSGGTLHYLGFSYCSDYRRPSAGVNRERPMLIASGAAVLIPAPVLRKVGAFDESFFMYHEDVDLTWRARLAGYGIRLVPEAKVWHKYEFSRNSRKMTLGERNRWYFLLKNFQWKTLLLVLPFAVLNELLICLFALKEGWLGGKLGSYGTLLRRMPDLLRSRREIQRLRRVSDRELCTGMGAELQFSEVKIPAVVLYNAASRAYWNLVRRML